MWAKTIIFFKSATIRLGLTYLVIIMAMTIGFSVVFYSASSRQLDRQLSPHSFHTDFAPERHYTPLFNQFLRQRIDSSKHALIIRLIYLDLTMLVLGALVSYWLARRALEPIEQSLQTQSQFVSDASHELRTPLTAIIASNDVALRRPNLSIKQARDVIQQNCLDAAKLQSLAEGLLKLARGDEQLEINSLALAEAASEAITIIEPLAKAKKVTIKNRVIPATVVLADNSLLAQIITVLLDNAIKYSPSGSVIKLGSVVRGRHALLTVKDQGRGISASDLPHIFERFYRVDSSRTKPETGGYGLGLAIADKLVQQLHGSISVASEAGKGSTFTIKLPLA